MITRLRQEYLHGESDENGDCLRAAMASIFGFDSLDGVPHFCSRENEQSSEGWHYYLFKWLDERGYTTVSVPFDREWVKACLSDTIYLLFGPSPRFPDELHIVIAYGFEAEIIHDPHPDNTGLLDPNEHHEWIVDLLVPKAPSCLQLRQPAI